MEEPSNGKVEESQMVELEQEDTKKITKDVEEIKLEDESVKQIDIDGNSKSLKEADHDGCSVEKEETDDKNPQAEESTLEKLDNEVSNIVEELASLPGTFVEDLVQGVEALLEEPQVKEVERKEEVEIPKENPTPVVVTDLMIDSTPLPPATSDGSEVVSNAANETIVPSSVENPDFTPVAGHTVTKVTEEKGEPSANEKHGYAVPTDLTEVESKVTDVANVAASVEEKTEDASVVARDETVKKSLPPTTESATIVGSTDSSPANTGNPSVVSINQRIMQPTSWKSCCGLFEVLRRSNR
ncbi:hypothetical protein K2173_023205 [Erythroxylum novogranatense]|uniref:Uncharacterized protein n=1 Tax=Erythroxylum novogranatense TaxID=1862640 RepID=A0AAV8T8C0_9ROSI|nr:hypothetical protein K2173_023205 [Erythroxylum novogranatense]